jgi:hypothetical protein
MPAHAPDADATGVPQDVDGSACVASYQSRSSRNVAIASEPPPRTWHEKHRAREATTGILGHPGYGELRVRMAAPDAGEVALNVQARDLGTSRTRVDEEAIVQPDPAMVKLVASFVRDVDADWLTVSMLRSPGSRNANGPMP